MPVTVTLLFIENNLRLLFLPLAYWLFLTILLRQAEEKWLFAAFGEGYEAYCCRVNRCIPWLLKRNWERK
ncbi:MAG: hypothetical protein IJU20_07360 [Clostridia bacterium]|nr:hypothetical protein [Clostridia bacterium]